MTKTARSLCVSLALLGAPVLSSLTLRAGDSTGACCSSATGCAVKSTSAKSSACCAAKSQYVMIKVSGGDCGALGDKLAKVKPFWYFGRAFTVKDETIDDAVSALQLARQQPEIDPSRSFFIGHSLGGMLAPRIALADGHVAGVIIMAGATREKLQDALPRQIEYMISLGGADTSALRAQLAQFQPFLNAIRRVTPARG